MYSVLIHFFRNRLLDWTYAYGVIASLVKIFLLFNKI